jgi:hypothetical protein
VHVGEPIHEALEHVLVERLARRDDRFASTLHELVERPIVEGDPHDRAVEQPSLVEPVERVEGHDLRQVSGDPEDDQDVRFGCGCV